MRDLLSFRISALSRWVATPRLLRRLISCMYLDTSGVTAPITLNFDANDLDSSARDADTQLNVQYRVGETGPVDKCSERLFCGCDGEDRYPTTHAVSVELPADAMNSPQLQIRIMTDGCAGA